MVDRVNWIDSIPKLKALKEIEKRASGVDRVIKTMIQVNISDEDQKSGCDFNDLQPILDYAASCNHLTVNGLMGIASFTDDLSVVGKEFASLYKNYQEFRKKQLVNCPLGELSMGMTNDLEVAIREGSTMIRVGTAIFGARD